MLAGRRKRGLSEGQLRPAVREQKKRGSRKKRKSGKPNWASRKELFGGAKKRVCTSTQERGGSGLEKN